MKEREPCGDRYGDLCPGDDQPECRETGDATAGVLTVTMLASGSETIMIKSRI